MYEWADFEKLVGCCLASHTDDASAADTTFWQSSTVAHADNAVRKQQLAEMRTAADFNREEEERKAKQAADAAANQ